MVMAVYCVPIPENCQIWLRVVKFKTPNVSLSSTISEDPQILLTKNILTLDLLTTFDIQTFI